MSESEVCEKYSAHDYRKECNRCQKRREEHPLREEDVDEIRQATRLFGQEAKPKHEKYAWVPPSCPPDRLDEYFERFPEEMVPEYDTSGQEHRRQRLLRQIPLQDLKPENCRFIKDETRGIMENVVSQLREKSLKEGAVEAWREGMPLQCQNCLEMMEPEELCVQSEKGAPVYHPECFKCAICKERLVDLIHCIDISGAVYCVRHFLETTKKRCDTCDELIYDPQYSQAGDKSYHRDHLRCFNCEGVLHDDKGYEKNSKLYCGECFEKLFAQDCKKCGKSISLNDTQVSFSDDSWHYDCFICDDCNASLADVPFEFYEEKFVCIECYNNKYAPRCEGCKERFEGKVKVLKYEEKLYHLDCFKCSDCKDSIRTGTFVPRMGQVYCKSCNTRNFSVRCIKCHNAITEEDGIMYKKKAYHRSCFTCSKCSVVIADRPFKSMENKCYCFPCYGKEFCKKCHACNEPIILGSEEDVLYSCNSYHWHSNCYLCSVCKSTGDSFTMKDDKLFCVKCLNSKDDAKKNSNSSVGASKE